MLRHAYHEAGYAVIARDLGRPLQHVAVSDVGGGITTTTEPLAGVVFHDEASALERRLLGVQDPGTKSPEPALLSGNA